MRFVCLTLALTLDGLLRTLSDWAGSQREEKILHHSQQAELGVFSSFFAEELGSRWTIIAWPLAGSKQIRREVSLCEGYQSDIIHLEFNLRPYDIVWRQYDLNVA